MKEINQVFNLPIPLSEIEDIKDVYNYAFASSDDYSVALHAGHAINCHADLVSALEGMAALHRKTYGLEGAFDAELLAAESALKKAKADLWQAPIHL